MKWGTAIEGACCGNEISERSLLSDQWEGESNESVYERCGMSACVNEVNYGVVEWVKKNTLKWFGHVERMGSEEFMKKVYESVLEGPNRRGRPLGKWKDRVEYLQERGINRRGVLEQARRECWDRETITRERTRDVYQHRVMSVLTEQENEQEMYISIVLCRC